MNKIIALSISFLILISSITITIYADGYGWDEDTVNTYVNDRVDIGKNQSKDPITNFPNAITIHDHVLTFGGDDNPATAWQIVDSKVYDGYTIIDARDQDYISSHAADYGSTIGNTQSHLLCTNVTGGWSFTMNNCTWKSGGQALLGIAWMNNCTLTLNNSTIDNCDYSLPRTGEGSYTMIGLKGADGHFVAINSSVSNNKVATNAIEMDSGSFLVGGNTTIIGNTCSGSAHNVLLKSGQTITVDSSNPLTDGAAIGVYTATTPSNSADVKIATGAKSGDQKYFISDNSAAGVIYCDGTADYGVDGNEISTCHHTHAANTIWLSVEAVHTHNWTFSNDGNTITATCSNANCPNGSTTLTLIANDVNYNGSIYALENIDLSNLSTFNYFSGQSLSKSSISYYIDEACSEPTTSANSGAVSDNGAPKNAGIYYAKISVMNGLTEVAKAVTAFEIKKFNHVVTPPTALSTTFDGNEHILISAGSCSTGEILYSLDGINYSNDIDTIKATNIGTYTVYYKVAGSDLYNEYIGHISVQIIDESNPQSSLSYVVPNTGVR